MLKVRMPAILTDSKSKATVAVPDDADLNLLLSFDEGHAPRPLAAIPIG